MIKRIVTVEDFDIVYENFRELAKTHPVKHFGIEFDPKTLWMAWRVNNLLINSCVLVCNFVDDTTIDALCWFVITHDWRIDKDVASSYLWISKDKKRGLQVFREALAIIERKRVPIVNVGYLLSSESAPRIEKMLQRMGYKPEDKSYYKTKSPSSII